MMQMSGRRPVQAAALLGAAALLAAGCTSQKLGGFENPAGTAPGANTGSTQAPSAPAPAALGTPADITEGGKDAATITVTTVDVTTQPGTQYGEAPANGYYAVGHIQATVLSSFTGGFMVNPIEFYALVNGQHFSFGDGHAFFAFGSGQSELNAATLAAGESTQGLIAFDIPAAHGLIVYAPNYNGQPVAEWTF